MHNGPLTDSPLFVYALLCHILVQLFQFCTMSLFFVYVALFSCWTFSVLISFHVSLKFPMSTFLVLHSCHIALFSCCTIFACGTFFVFHSFMFLFMLNTLFPCCIFSVSQSLYFSLFLSLLRFTLCCTFFMFHFFCVALPSYCMLFMMYYFHVAVFSCFDIFMSHFYPVALFNIALSILHYFHVTLILLLFSRVALFLWCSFFGIALFQCCISCAALFSN